VTEPYVRQDIWTLEATPWNSLAMAYALAVREMQARPASDPTSWVYQASVHATPDPQDRDDWRDQCQHNSWFFLPWHRMYLYWFERIVRAIVQTLEDVDDSTKDTWALPYWDYDRGGTNALPPAFREAQLPNGDDNPLRTDERNPSINAGGGLPGLATSAQNALAEMSFSEPLMAGVPSGFGGPITGWHHFAENGTTTPGELERTPHNDVHGLVGGGGFMSRFETAPLDPVFWLHHANIDRLWALWTGSFAGENPLAAAWLDRVFHFHDEGGQDVTMTPGDVLDVAADLGYRYADMPALVVQPEAVMPPSPPPPEHPAELVGATDTPLELSGDAATVQLSISPPSGPLRALAAEEPNRVYLNVEDIEAERNPGISYAVYVNVPDDDADAANDVHYAGNVSFFGVEQAQDVDRDHSGGRGSLRYAFDISDLVKRLMAEHLWDPERMRVMFVPLRVEAPPGVAAAEAATPPVRVGRVSLFYR
jgi:tyrosinase